MEGKTINFLGDSITECVGVVNLKNRYDNRLKNMLNLKAVYNYGIPVLNLYKKLGIDPNIEEHRARFTDDGLHFIDNGHAALAERLAKFLLNCRRWYLCAI